MNERNLNLQLIDAVHFGNIDLAQHLIQYGASANTRFGGKNTTLLMLAAEYSNLGMMQMLINNGAAINEIDRDGNYAIHYSAENGHLEGVKLLMAHRILAQVGNNRMVTPMMIASSNGHFDVVHYLLCAGVPMKSGYHFSGDTELTLASEKGHADVVNLLLNYGNWKGDRANEISRALMSAVAHNKFQVATLLLNRGANPNFRLPLQNPMIFLVVDNGNLELLRLLIYHKADINARDEYDRTPLMKAIERRHKSVIRALIEAGADISEKDTLLWLACETGDNDIVNLIMDLIRYDSSPEEIY